MSTPAELAITQAIADPASASADGQSVSSRSASDLIALLQFQAASTAAGLRHRGIRYQRLLTPGAFGGGYGQFGPYPRGWPW